MTDLQRLAGSLQKPGGCAGSFGRQHVHLQTGKQAVIDEGRPAEIAAIGQWRWCCMAVLVLLRSLRARLAAGRLVSKFNIGTELRQLGPAPLSGG